MVGAIIDVVSRAMARYECECGCLLVLTSFLSVAAGYAIGCEVGIGEGINLYLF